MTAEDKLFLKRLNDLDHIANKKYMVSYSSFLNPTEYSIFLDHRQEFMCNTAVFDKIDYLERQMIAFIPDALVFEGEFPIRVIKVMPKNQKFAQTLTHRDVLGTIMGLSIDRKLVGDIISEENIFYVLLHEQIEEYVRMNISRIKHTEVVLEAINHYQISIQRKYEKIHGTIASMRLDCIISEMNRCSRTQSLKLIQEGFVFLNNRQVYHNSAQCKLNDIISIRHVGKFRINEMGERSKKGKIKIVYEKYC